MKQLFLLVIILASVLKVSATAQCGDILVWGNDTFCLFSNPLEEREDIALLREKLNKMGVAWGSTACWRGYIATWGIEGNELYLLNIRGDNYRTNSIEADLNVLLPDEVSQGKVKARWFSGSLILPLGKMLYCEHNGYATVYEREIELTVQDGRLTERKEWDNGRTYLSEYTKNKELRFQWIYSNIDWEKLPEVNEIRVFIRVLGTENRKPQVELIRGCGMAAFDEEALRVVGTLPDWNFIYRRGKVINVPWVIPVIFNREMKEKYAHVKKN